MYPKVCEIWSEKFKYSYKIKTSTDHFHIHIKERFTTISRFLISCFLPGFRLLKWNCNLIHVAKVQFLYHWFSIHCFLWLWRFILLYNWIFFLKLYIFSLKSLKTRTSVSDKISFTIQQLLCVAIYEIEYHELIFWFSD